jgi:hypothetical protein
MWKGGKYRFLSSPNVYNNNNILRRLVHLANHIYEHHASCDITHGKTCLEEGLYSDANDDGIASCCDFYIFCSIK